MKKPNFTNAFKNVKVFATKHSPEILTGIGIAGMIMTTVLAVKATPKALELIEKQKKEEQTDDLTPIEVVKTTWKCYVPAVATGAASITCLIGASSVNFRRNAVLAAAYKLSETTLSDYEEKVVEVIGEKKEKEIREAVVKDKLKKQPVNASEVIITEKGNTLCFDTLSGRYFKSDRELVNRSVNNLNRKMRNDNYCSLNEFYDELGLDHIDIGYDLGWNIDRGYLEVDFGSHLASDGTPCMTIEYLTRPQYDYDKFA